MSEALACVSLVAWRTDFKGLEREKLGHDVGHHTRSQVMQDPNTTLLHLLEDEVLRQTKVPSAVVELRVAQESLLIDTLVVAKELNWFTGSLRELREELIDR